MACDCISQIDAKLAPDHKLEIAIVFRDSTLVARPFSRLMRRDNGRPETRRGKHSTFIATFCPFCGVRYEPAPAVPADTSSGE